MLSIADLEKSELVFAGTHAYYKFAEIMKGFLIQDRVVMQRKESLLTLEFTRFVGVTKILFMSQFGNDKGEMSWQGKGSLQNETTQLINQKAKAVVKVEAMGSLDTVMV